MSQSDCSCWHSASQACACPWQGCQMHMSCLPLATEYKTTDDWSVWNCRCDLSSLTCCGPTCFDGAGRWWKGRVFARCCMTVRCRLPSAERHCVVMHLLRNFGPPWARQNECRVSLAVPCLSALWEGASGCHGSLSPPCSPCSLPSKLS